MLVKVAFGHGAQTPDGAGRRVGIELVAPSA
jgi:hypothetical protein